MKSNKKARREGNVIMMTAFLMVGLVAFLALAIDVGYLYSVRAELQRTADAAAIAACWELIDQDGPAGGENATSLSADARDKAVQFASLNKVATGSPDLATDDVVVGYMANPANPSDPLIAVPGGTLPNAVQVRVQRTNAQNGQISLFFAKALGNNDASLDAQATAALVSTFSGFQSPADGSNLHILPFAIDENTWNGLTTYGTDSWNYNPDTKAVTAGCDNVKEVNLYPQGTGSPGTRGTVDIGGSNNSTADIARQIVHGISPADMAAMGGSLEFGDDGILHLNGDTGISAGVKDELASIIGKPRIIPVFRSVVGPGNNADYSIVKFVGVRILDVKLTGSMSSKRVIVQPCNVVAKGGIYEPNATGSQYIYSPVWLAR
jgi:Flp pilus assembly protein TadG